MCEPARSVMLFLRSTTATWLPALPCLFPNPESCIALPISEEAVGLLSYGFAWETLANTSLGAVWLCILEEALEEMEEAGMSRCGEEPIFYRPSWFLSVISGEGNEHTVRKE